MTRPEVGDPVPPFEMSADDGSSVSSESLLGRRYVLYFYPKDDTPGCTKQACGLRDSFSAVIAAGVDVYGISPDSVKSHVKFRDKYALPYRLLSDVGHRVADAFGVWIEKSFRGRTYMGTERTSFIIGPQGSVEHVLPRVKPDEHVGLILEAVGA
jgi:peroxiredoxin Q/BCP